MIEGSKSVFNQWCMDSGLEYVEIVDPSTVSDLPAPTEPTADADDECADPFGIKIIFYFI